MWDKRPSPYWDLLGMKLVENGPGYARLQMPVREEIMQRFGVVHGGAIASLVDAATAAALFHSFPAMEVILSTVEMKVNYLAPIKQGMVTAEAKIARQGRTIAVGAVEVKDAGGTLAAIGIVTYMIIHPDKRRA
jgi:uncharacterized protein (TIGR00369 family)